MAKRKSYPGRIDQRTADTWRVRLWQGGKGHTYTVHGDREDAEAFANEEAGRLEEEARRAAEGRPGPLTFSKLTGEYERLELPSKAAGTRKSYKTSLAVLREYFDGLGDPKVTRIRRGHVARFRSWRRTRGGTATAVSDHTVARDMRVLHLLLACRPSPDPSPDPAPADGVHVAHEPPQRVRSKLRKEVRGGHGPRCRPAGRDIRPATGSATEVG